MKKALLIIVIFAVVLRLVKFGQIATFGFDSSRDLILTYKMLNYGEIIYRGPVFSVIWGFVSPIYYYLLFPFHVLFNFNPNTSSFVGAIFGLLTVVIAFYAAKKMNGNNAAIAAASVFAASFYFIYHNLIGLNPSLSPPFAVLYIWSVYEVLVKSNYRFLKWLALSAAMLMAFHPSGFFIVIPTLILLTIYRPKFNLRKYILPSAIFFIVGVLPYLIQEKKFQWWTFKQTIIYMNNSRDDGGLRITDYFRNYIVALSKNISDLLLGNTSEWGIVFGIIVLLVLLSSALLFYKFRNPLTFTSLFVTIYIISFGLVVKFEDTEPKDTWMGAVFVPMLIIYIGILVSEIHRRGYKLLSWGLLIVILSLNFYKYLSFIPKTDSVLYQKEIAQVLRVNSEGENFDVYGLNPEPIYYYMWYLEEPSPLKEEYLTWIKWTKEKDQNLVYFVTDSYELNDEKIEEINDEHGTTSHQLIYTSSLSKNIYRFE